jgi:hypothetical protein
MGNANVLPGLFYYPELTLFKKISYWNQGPAGFN